MAFPVAQSSPCYGAIKLYFADNIEDVLALCKLLLGYEEINLQLLRVHASKFRFSLKTSALTLPIANPLKLIKGGVFPSRCDALRTGIFHRNHGFSGGNGFFSPSVSRSSGLGVVCLLRPLRGRIKLILAVAMQQFSADRPGSGRRSRHWLPSSGGFLYGWPASPALPGSTIWHPSEDRALPAKRGSHDWSWLLRREPPVLSMLAARLAGAGGCWRALRRGAIYKPPGGTCPRL